MRENRVLIGYITFTVMALIAAILKWGMYYVNDEHATSGWDDYLRIYGFAGYNWMASLTIILIGFSLSYKELKNLSQNE
jgi:hypothetical protein